MQPAIVFVGSQLSTWLPVTWDRESVTGNHVDNCEPTNTIAGCTS